MKRALITLLAAAIGFIVGALFQWGLPGLSAATLVGGGLGWFLSGQPAGGGAGAETRWQGGGNDGATTTGESGGGDGGG